MMKRRQKMKKLKPLVLVTRTMKRSLKLKHAMAKQKTNQLL
jgi:hypothetical protein